MTKQSWRDRLIDPRSPDRRPRRAAYALPTMFTAGNVFLGFYALIESFQASMAMINDAAAAPHHFQNAAVAIGWSVFLDGLDGRIARLTNTVSEFGREMDSLADSMSFGIAPAVLAFSWGVQFVDPSVDARILDYLHSAGLLRGVPVSAVRGGAPGALQYPEEPDSEKSRASGPQIFRRPADSGRGCGGGGGDLRRGERAGPLPGSFRHCGWRCWDCCRS